ncbi:MAG: hypothetical protein AAB250_02305 [Bdellovibrionota bacterium]
MKKLIFASILFASSLVNAAPTAAPKSLSDEVLVYKVSAQRLVENAIKRYEGMAKLPKLTIQWNNMRCLQSPTSEIGGEALSGVCMVSATGFQVNAQMAIILQRHTILAEVIYVDVE